MDSQGCKESKIFYPEEELLSFLIAHGAEIDPVYEDGGTLLMLAVSIGGADLLVRFLIESSEDINTRDNEGCTALTYAYHSLDYMALLLNAGADIQTRDNRGRTVMHHLASRGVGGWHDWTSPGVGWRDFTEEIQFLVDHGVDINARDNDGVTPLMLCINETATGCFHSSAGDIDMLERLLKAGADADAADNRGCSVLMHSLPSPLEHARTCLEHVLVVQDVLKSFLKKRVPDKNAVDFMMKVGWGTEEEVQAALSHPGADLEMRDSGGFTPLMRAVFFNTADIVRFMIGAGANVNAESTGGATRLSWGSLYRFADVNAESTGGTTPLMIALLEKKWDSAKILLEAGADAVGLNSSMVFLMRMCKIGDGMRDLLINAGANPSLFEERDAEDDEPYFAEKRITEKHLAKYGLKPM